MSLEQKNFRKLHFKSPDTFDPKWIEWFREEYGRQLYKLDIEPNPEAPFKFEATTQILPDLAIAQSVRSPMRTLHRGGADDDVSFQIVLSGQLSVEAAGKTHTIVAGMGGIGRHGTRAVIDVPEDVRLLSVRLRRRLLEPLIGTSALQGFAVLQDTQATRLLISYLRTLTAEETLDSPASRILAAVHVHDLVALAFGATRDAAVLATDRGAAAARLESIKGDIMGRLGDADLSISQVAQRHRVSQRLVQTLFERAGTTFSEFVLEQRLLYAYRVLRSPLGHTGKVGDVAHMCGFGDISYFYRAFRRRFGATPTDVRSLAAGER